MKQETIYGIRPVVEALRSVRRKVFEVIDAGSVTALSGSGPACEEPTGSAQFGQLPAEVAPMANPCCAMMTDMLQHYCVRFVTVGDIA